MCSDESFLVCLYRRLVILYLPFPPHIFCNHSLSLCLFLFLAQLSRPLTLCRFAPACGLLISNDGRWWQRLLAVLT